MTEDIGSKPHQYSTFYIANRLYGIDVMKVQEVTKSLPMTRVPLAPDYVYGLINLRGQIATAIGLRELFKLENEKPESHMNVVCRVGDVLLSFIVDKIGDVLEVDPNYFEETPDTVSENIAKFMTGIYKMQADLLSVIDIEALTKSISQISDEESISK